MGGNTAENGSSNARNGSRRSFPVYPLDSGADFIRHNLRRFIEGLDRPLAKTHGRLGRALEFIYQFVHFFLSVNPQPLWRKSHAGNKRLGSCAFAGQPAKVFVFTSRRCRRCGRAHEASDRRRSILGCRD
jgi:hypothetical protein